MWMKPSPWVWIPAAHARVVRRGLELRRVAEPLAADVHAECRVPVVARLLSGRRPRRAAGGIADRCEPSTTATIPNTAMSATVP